MQGKMNSRAVFACAILGILLAAAPVLAAPAVTITGTSRVILFGTGTRFASWTANVSSGVPPYRYQWFWNGYPVASATGQTFGGTYYGPGRDGSWTDVVSVVVTDATGATGSDAHSISVTTYAQGTDRN